MNHIIKVSASAVSHIGNVHSVNSDNFYMNGRFMFEHETDNIQVSIEKKGKEFVFAVCERMERDIPDRSTSISAVKELAKIQKKIESSSKDINVKFQMLSECIEETSNLIYSETLGRSGEVAETAFAGMLISDGKGAVLSSGNCRTYLFRQGTLKQLFADYKKAERLLKLGIITNEQAKILSNRFGVSDSEDLGKIKKSEIVDIVEGDLIIICTDGVGDIVEEDYIYEALCWDKDTGNIANMIISNALKTGGEDNMTALVIKVESPDEEDEYIKASSPIRHVRSAAARPKRIPVKPAPRRIDKSKALTTLSLCILIPVVLFWTIGLLARKGKDNDKKSTSGLVETTDYLNTNQDGKDTLDETEQSHDENSDQEDVETPEIGNDIDDDGVTYDETGGTVIYKVKQGDTLYGISMRFYNDAAKVSLIMEVNNIDDPNLIQVGKDLKIPNPEKID